MGSRLLRNTTLLGSSKQYIFLLKEIGDEKSIFLTFCVWCLISRKHLCSETCKNWLDWTGYFLFLWWGVRILYKLCAKGCNDDDYDLKKEVSPNDSYSSHSILSPVWLTIIWLWTRCLTNLVLVPFLQVFPFLFLFFEGNHAIYWQWHCPWFSKKLNYIHSYALQRSKIWINLRLWHSPKYKKNPPRLIIFTDDLSLHECTVCSSGELKEAASQSQLDGDSTGHLQLIASQRKHLNWGRSDPE